MPRQSQYPIEAAHPLIAGALESAAHHIADTFKPPVHSALDHWCSLSILFVVACGLVWASAQGWIA